MVLGLIKAEIEPEIKSDVDTASEQKKELIRIYGDNWHIAGQLCNEEGWIKWYEYHDRFPTNYKTKTIDGVVCYRPKAYKVY
jgi:hypothetical protein